MTIDYLEQRYAEGHDSKSLPQDNEIQSDFLQNAGIHHLPGAGDQRSPGAASPPLPVFQPVLSLVSLLQNYITSLERETNDYLEQRYAEGRDAVALLERTKSQPNWDTGSSGSSGGGAQQAGGGWLFGGGSSGKKKSR